MLLERTQLGFRTAKGMFVNNLTQLRESGRYSSIIAMLYDKLEIKGFVRTEKTTALIDLRMTEDDIFKNFSDTTRNEIRKSLNNPDSSLTIGEVTPESYRLYSAFEFSQNRVPVSQDELHQCMFFGVSLSGELLSGLYILAHKPYLRIRSIFSRRLETEDKDIYKCISNSTRRALWEVCRWGKQNGYVSLDLASVNFNNPQTANITRFKMSFGGKIVSEYTYTYKTPLFSLLENGARLKVIVRKLLHRLIHRSSRPV